MAAFTNFVNQISHGDRDARVLPQLPLYMFRELLDEYFPPGRSADTCGLRCTDAGEE